MLPIESRGAPPPWSALGVATRRRRIAAVVALGLCGCTSTVEPVRLPFAGGQPVEGLAEARLVGSRPGGSFGSALAFFARDGQGWLAIGAPFEDGRGAVHVVRVDPGQSAPTAHRWTGDAPGDLAGSAVACPGDLDGDGLSDLAIGAWGRRGRRSEADAGAVYVTFSPARGGDLEHADLVVTGGPGDALGFSLADGSIDANGDGAADLVVSAFHAGDSSGALFVFYGPLAPGRTTVSAADAVLRGERAGDHAGIAWSPAGDLDGDGTTELVVGAPLRAGVAGEHAGAVFLAHGPHVGERSLRRDEQLLEGDVEGALAGSALAVLDGPGGRDVVSASPAGAGRTGQLVRVSLASGARGGRLRSSDTEGGFGFGLSAVGDLDRDGTDELLVLAPWAGGRGRIYLVAGRELRGDRLADDVVTTWIEGAAAGDRLGAAVAVTRGGGRAPSAADAWVALGAPGSDAGGLDAGEVVWLSIEEER